MNNALSKIAEDFAELAEGGKIIRNNDEILKEISELKDYDDRVELAGKEFEELGVGSSRIIFKMSDSLVLKVAKNEKGIYQNASEMEIHSPCLNNVLAADTEGKWVIVRFTDSMSADEFEEAVGIPFKTFGSAIFYRANNEKHEDKPRDYDEIIEHPLFVCIFDLVMDYELQAGDVLKISSWGMLEGKPVLRDFGLTKDIYAEYYEDDSDNNKTTV